MRISDWSSDVCSSDLIVDFLVEVGKALDFDKNVHLQEAAARNVHFSTLGSRVLENCYRDIAWFFTREAIEAEAEQSLGSLDTVDRSEEHTSELQSLMRISYAVFCLKQKTT